MTHISAQTTLSSRKDARVERTRAALRDALLALIEERAVEQITIRDISARAGAGYATFFRHYPDKAALLHDLAATELAELLERALPILVAADTRAACVALCSYVDERRQLWAALLTGGAAATLREEFLRQARAIAASYRQPGAWLPAELAVVFGVSGVVELLTYWLHHPQQLTLEQIAELVERLVIRPVLQAPTGLTTLSAAAAAEPARARKLPLSAAGRASAQNELSSAAPARQQKKPLPAADRASAQNHQQMKAAHPRNMPLTAAALASAQKEHPKAASARELPLAAAALASAQKEHPKHARARKQPLSAAGSAAASVGQEVAAEGVTRSRATRRRRGAKKRAPKRDG